MIKSHILKFFTRFSMENFQFTQMNWFIKWHLIFSSSTYFWKVAFIFVLDNNYYLSTGKFWREKFRYLRSFLPTSETITFLSHNFSIEKSNSFFSIKKWENQKIRSNFSTSYRNFTDTLKFWTEKRAINKTFLFFNWFWWNWVKL